MDHTLFMSSIAKSYGYLSVAKVILDEEIKNLASLNRDLIAIRKFDTGIPYEVMKLENHLNHTIASITELLHADAAGIIKEARADLLEIIREYGVLPC